MAGPRDVSFAIRARDRTRSAFRAVGRGLGRLRAQFSLLRTTIATGAIAALAAFANRAGQFAANLRQQAARTGTSVEGFQRLAFALSQLGNVRLETAATGLQRFFRNTQEALQGNPELLRAFKELGVGIGDLKRLSPEEIFFKLADGFASATDRGKAFEALVQIGDTEIAQLVDALEEGSVAIRKVGEEFDRAGGILKEFEVNQLEEIGSGFSKLFAALKTGGAIFVALIGDIIGLPRILQTSTDAVLALTRRFRDLRKINKELGFAAALSAAFGGPVVRPAPVRAVNQAAIDQSTQNQILIRIATATEGTTRELKDFSVVGP